MKRYQIVLSVFRRRSYFISQWLFYTPLVWGKLLALGDIGGLEAVPPAGSRGRAPGPAGGLGPPEAECFLFHFFLRHAQRSNPLTDFEA